MGVQEYLDARKQAAKMNDTVNGLFFDGMRDLMEACKDSDGLVNRENLEKDDVRVRAANAFYDKISGWAKIYFGASVSDPFRLEQLAFGATGLGKDVVTEALQASKGNTDFSRLYGSILEDNVVGYMRNRNLNRAPRANLSETDAKAVISHVKLDGQIDERRVTADDLAELLNQFEANKGTITPAFLKGKKYLATKN